MVVCISQTFDFSVIAESFLIKEQEKITTKKAALLDV